MDRTVLDALCEAVVEHRQPRRIVLFGSQATGDAGPNSDIGGLVVEEADAKGRIKRWVSLQRALPKSHHNVDLVLTNVAEWDRWSGGLNPLYARASGEGRVLHERP